MILLLFFLPIRMVTVDGVGFTREAVILGSPCPSGIFFRFSAFPLHTVTCGLKRSEHARLSWLSSRATKHGSTRQHLVFLWRGSWRSMLLEAAGLACRCAHKDQNYNRWKTNWWLFQYVRKMMAKWRFLCMLTCLLRNENRVRQPGVSLWQLSKRSFRY